MSEHTSSTGSASTRRDLDAILRPRSVAVVGASTRKGSIGNAMLRHLIEGGFTGPVYPVNPRADSVAAVPAFPSVTDLPAVPDLAFIVVPREHVLPAVRECGEKGVQGLVVITAGFREVGGEGVALEAELARTVHEYGMRMVGPNCMGVLNTSSTVSMNGTFAPFMPPAGPIAFMSQSGAMGMTILDYATEYGIGISQFVSVGNKTDVSGNALIEYWRDDDEVGVILMYLESFGNPRTFVRLARETTRLKPVLVVKAGRTAAGAKAASSHTGALAQVDIATDALLAQCGVQRADSVEELFDAAIAFSKAPLPRGNRVAILTNAGGPGIIIADACEGHGLEVAPLSDTSRAALKRILPLEASVSNPVDMIASATPEQVEKATRILLADEGIDALIASYVPLALEAPLVARAIRAGAEGSDKPALAVLMSKRGLPQGMAELKDSPIPAYRFPESAARALGAMWKHARWHERPEETVRRFATDDDAIRERIVAALAEGRDRLTMIEGFEVLAAAGIPVAPWAVARSADDAVAAAEGMGFPVVLKPVSAAILHKTEVGAVRLDLETGDEVREAFAAVDALLDDAGPAARNEGVLVQKMLKGGRETIVGMTWEQRFGPIVMVGLGGVYVEVLQDVAFRVQPVSTQDAHEMIRSLRGYRILEGVRGEPGIDLDLLAEVVERVSQLVGRHPEIREMDINPFLAFPEADRCAAVDARFAIAPPEEEVEDA
ncbi:MAG: acetate--CoA ligase family protein [Gemmatimonadota bacterium]|nr:acetate--CoA ligase family protein [Gemmatimonadota bacterium]